jgi:hypothetical protein
MSLTKVSYSMIEGASVSVKDFGAVGDGVTNDRSAIQAAIDAMGAQGGGEVYLENKTYIIQNALFWRSNVLLRGSGQSILKIANGVDANIITTPNQQTTAPLTNLGAFGIIFDGNYQNSPGVAAASVVAIDPVDGAYFERCVFKNGRGYGASLQSLATGIPNNERIKNVTFIQCDFNNNGWGTAPPGAQYDGVDVKNCNGLTFIRCRAFDNAVDGFDFRGDNIELIACEAYNNGSSGLQASANANGYTQKTYVRVIGGHYHDNVNGISIANDPAGGLGITRVDIVGASVQANTGDGIYFFSFNTTTYVTINAKIFANGGKGIFHQSTKQTILNSCQIVNNVGDGIYTNALFAVQVNGGLIQGNGGWGYIEGSGASRNVLAGGLKIIDNTLGNILLNAIVRTTKVDPSVSDYSPADAAPAITDIIPSAANITLPTGGQLFAITGNDTISSIDLSYRGRIVALQFTGNAIVNDSATLFLAGTFNASDQDVLTLCCNGTFWFEMSRSTN